MGHSQESPNSGRANAIVLSNGISSGNEGSQSITPGSTPDSAPNLQTRYGVGDQVSAGSVALFGCNPYDLAGQYGGTDFTGVQSGADGTMLDTLDLQAAAFVNAGGGQPGVNAANTVIDNSQYPEHTGDNTEREKQ